MANVTITSSGTYQLGQNDQAILDIPDGGVVTLQAANDNVDKIRINSGSNDNQSDKVIVDLTTFAQDGLRIDLFKYDPSDEIQLDGATIIGANPDDPSEMLFTYVGSDGNTYSGYVNLMDGGEKDFTVPEPPIIICFTAGTRIRAEHGDVRVEDLRVGDLVQTRDNGLRPIRWIGRRKLSASDLADHPNLFPVRIAPGAIAQDVPERRLVVSPQHRMVVSSKIAHRMFGTSDVLIPAKKLTALPRIKIDTSVDSVDYIHLLFDNHEIIFAEGAPTESLFTGPEMMKSLSAEARQEIFTLFPEIASIDYRPSPALHIPLGRLQKRLVQRHAKNRKPLLDQPHI